MSDYYYHRRDDDDVDYQLHPRYDAPRYDAPARYDAPRYHAGGQQHEETHLPLPPRPPVIDTLEKLDACYYGYEVSDVPIPLAGQRRLLSIITIVVLIYYYHLSFLHTHFFFHVFIHNYCKLAVTAD